MTEIASLSLQVKYDSAKGATAALKEMVPAASAAERAAQKWGVTTTEAGRSTEAFSKRVQGTIKQLEFERQQLTRNSAEQQRYAALRRAGVSAMSAEGQAISASVAALQAQKAAREAENKASGVQVITTRAASSAWRGMISVLAPLTAMMTAAAVAQKIWTTAMDVADFGEKAEQMGVMAKTMQAMQFAAIQNGLSAEQLENGVAKFSQKIGEAADGSKEMIEALDKIGVKVLDVSGKLRPTEDLLFEVAQKIMAIDDPARRAAAAVDFFGKAGVKMLPLLKQMADGQDVMSEAARRAGAMISDDVIAKLDTFSDRLAANGLKIRASFANLAADIIDWGNRVDAWWAKISPNDAGAVKARHEAIKRGFEDFFDWLGDSFADIIAKAGGWAVRFAAEFQSIGTSLKRIFTEAMNGVLEAIETGLNMAQSAVNKAKTWFGAKSTTAEPFKFGRLDPGQYGDRNAGAEAQAAAEARIRAGMPNSADIRAQQRAAAGMMDYGESVSAGGAAGPRAAAITPPGARQPGVKASGSDPYAKAIESAKEYVLAKQAETKAVGENVQVAAQLKHEQDLLNKATGEGKTLSVAQTAAIKEQAAQMAAADNALATAKFKDDRKTKTEEFLQQQQAERDALFMSAEAVARARFEQEGLNDAKARGIELTPEIIQGIKDEAAARAESQEKTRRYTEQVQLAKDVVGGFMRDINQGIRDGAGVWEILGNAAMNALTMISDKLMQMAVDKLFEAAFPSKGGGGGGGGGIVDMIFGAIGAVAGGAAGGGAAGSGSVWAKGGAFRHGNVIPFAGGGVVSSPTMFPMSGGRTGLMGEAGDEAIMPLRRGPGGRLGVEAAGGGAASGRVTVVVTGDTDLVRVTARDEAGAAIVAASPGIEGRAVKKSGQQVVPLVERNQVERGGDWRNG